ncbi:MAG: DNA mismatch repair endonuclease MutL [Alicyclobacillaceae bacterium]|nr:DNA mismatch repair endonuclease MutL [Alicyclobacillaceae bacterium]
MGVIQLMSPALANQIAAGEVVERPASCVKELIENSLDAGARRIHVSIVEGGIREISVEDDGVGMSEEDAVLSFARHATSKLLHARDLTQVRTLGFRGEALAAIAAVAKVELVTRQAEKTSAVCVSVEGSDEVSVPVAVQSAPGTRICVRELFFNTPARLKYLRSVQTESARCAEVVQRAALAHPEVAFRLSVDGHSSFSSPGRGNLRSVLAALYGPSEAANFLEGKSGTADFELEAWIGRPNQAKSNRAHGHLFVNQRPIRNLTIHQAIVAGYGSRLMVNRHPMYFLHIRISPTLVDVNIHPHKAEVRFSEERELALAVERMVASILDGVQLTAVPTFSNTARQLPESLVRGPLSAERDRPMDRQTATYQAQPLLNGVHEWRHELPAVFARDIRESGKVQTETDASLPPCALDATQSHEEYRAARAPEEAVPRSRPENWSLRSVGQVLGMYIVAEDAEHVYIIDQHAAHERILFERFSAQMKERQGAKIPLLVPLTLTLSPSEHVFWQKHQETFANLGLETEGFGDLDVLIRSIPEVWEGLDVDRLVEDIIRSSANEGFAAAKGTRTVDAPDALRQMVVLRACKAAIKANHRLSAAEMEALCRELTTLDDPFHCPHGRPVFLELSAHYLEKEFRRIV